MSERADSKPHIRAYPPAARYSMGPTRERIYDSRSDRATGDSRD